VTLGSLALLGIALTQAPHRSGVADAATANNAIERLAAGVALSFSSQPTASTAGQPFTSQVTVLVRDANGAQDVADSTTVVTLAITPGTGTSGAVLTCSKDSTFNTNPATATAVIYSALIHGGVTTPANTYSVPTGFPLEPGTQYYWRGRPRAQGDAVPVDWSASFTFRTAASP